MADANATDTTVVDNTAIGDEIPLPDNLAETELNGLTPAEDSTESEQVEAEQEETEQVQPPENPDDTPDEGEEAGKTSEEKPEIPPEQPENKAELTPEEQQRQHNAQMAARRIAARQRGDFVNGLRQQTRAYEEQSDMSDVTEQVKVLQAQQYIDTVDRNRSTLINENSQAQATIPLFNPNSPDYNPALYQRAINRFNDTYIVTDPDTNEALGAQDRNGNNVSLFQYLQQEAADYSDLIGSSQAGAQVQAHKAEAKMRAKAVNPQGGGKTASQGGADSEEALLARIGDTPLNGG